MGIPLTDVYYAKEGQTGGMGLPESRISGNVYDKCDNVRWMEALDFADIQKTTYFDSDELVRMESRYFENDSIDAISKWSDVFA